MTTPKYKGVRKQGNKTRRKRIRTRQNGARGWAVCFKRVIRNGQIVTVYYQKESRRLFKMVELQEVLFSWLRFFFFFFIS